MRRFSPIAVLMTAVLALSACGTSTANTGGPVKLTYFTLSAAPDHLTDLNTIISAFHSQHSNITIDVQPASYNDYFTKLQTAIAGGPPRIRSSSTTRTSSATRALVRCSTCPGRPVVTAA